MPEQGKLEDDITTYRWIRNGVVVASCDACHRRVFTDRPRLQIHDKKGSDRPGGKGSRSTYICERCAWKTHHLIPPKTYAQSKTKKTEAEDNQGELW